MTQVKSESARHTPGPFSISGIPGDNYIMARLQNSSSGHKVSVCQALGWASIKPEELEANKRLFVASPDLLEACKRAIAVLTEGKTCTGNKAVAVNVLTDAITKATQ